MKSTAMASLPARTLSARGLDHMVAAPTQGANDRVADTVAGTADQDVHDLDSSCVASPS